MPFIYDVHIHTRQGSKCASASGAEQARFYKELGFQGIIITDHFFHGNTAVDPSLPWKERVEWFCSGYEDALIAGQKIGLDVFFGWEQNFGHDEYLIYGLDKQWLLNHPEMLEWNRAQQLEQVHRYGGCVVQAHPFRDRGYIDYVKLCPQFCDGAEVLNMGNHPYNDAAALPYAKEFGLAITAGSDNHHADLNGANASETICGIILDTPLASVQDYVKLILSKAQLRFTVPDSRFVPAADAPEIVTYWLDENEQRIPTNRSWLK